uniref:Synembryn n=1 Tax=Poecilia latipinna TaxID=48699 RepID=A0A3B3TIW9_9TELE
FSQRLLQIQCSTDRYRRFFLLTGLAAALLGFVGGQLQPAVLRACLHTLRILSRDRRAMGPMITDSALLTLTHLGGINLRQPSQQQDKTKIQDQCDRTQTQIHGKEAKAAYHGPWVELSALLWLPQERGVLVLTSALEQRLVLRWTDGNQLIPDSTSSPVSKEVSQDVIEILKIIFNVAHRLYRQEPDEEEAALYRRLAAVLHHCLLLSCDGADTLEELQGHTVNILSALPLTCLDVLLAVPVGQASYKYEGVNMDCVHALVLFMDRRLNRGQKLKEKLTPVLSLLTESSRVHRETRHYLRQKILPPLKDVAVRPEQDSTLRGQLVRLMTHVDTDVKDCAAELLFVLCKENVSRFVKYTGYGNAAGLLAARGLLNGRRNSGDGQFASHYSSDSDSDTEEYRQARSKINLVTGRVEAEQPDPMEGMTEEEKEKEHVLNENGRFFLLSSSLDLNTSLHPLLLHHCHLLDPNIYTSNSHNDPSII